MLKDRIGELKATRDQARLDAERAEEAIDRAGPSITAQALKTFARTARKRMRTENGGYRRDHLRALAQRVEIDQKELRIMGSKSVLLRTLVAAESAKTAGFGVPSSVRVASTFGGWRSIQLSYGRISYCLVRPTSEGQRIRRFNFQSLSKVAGLLRPKPLCLSGSCLRGAYAEKYRPWVAF
jgi:hypothetical protein